MRRGPFGSVVLSLAALAGACSKDRPAAAPPPSPPAADASGLRPLTSRDDARPFAPAEPSSGPTLPPGHPPIDGAAPTSGGAPAHEDAAVSGTVTIAASLAGRASSTDVLYVIARNRASKTVVAVRREQGARFPHAFELSGADAMTQGQPFVGPFDVTARLSKSGDAIAAPGDLEGTVENVAQGARGLSVVIEKVRQ